jgi:hypothetical protein
MGMRPIPRWVAPSASGSGAAKHRDLLTTVVTTTTTAPGTPSTRATGE